MNFTSRLVRQEFIDLMWQGFMEERVKDHIPLFCLVDMKMMKMKEMSLLTLAVEGEISLETRGQQNNDMIRN